MTQITPILLTVFASVMASGGLWSFLEKRKNKKDKSKDLLAGLAHDRLMHLGMVYVDRGFITEDEYENYIVWLYEPYEALGYNGVVKRIKQEVDKLEVKKSWISTPLENKPFIDLKGVKQ